MKERRQEKNTLASPISAAILETPNGDTILLAEKSQKPKGERSGGVIYTDEMPSLRELLDRYEIVSAVIQEKPAPEVFDAVSDREGKGLPFLPILALGGLPASTFTAGVVMLIGALGATKAMSNAYIGLMLLLGGLGLGVTAYMVLRQDARD